jgi:hypothetical protein
MGRSTTDQPERELYDGPAGHALYDVPAEHKVYGVPGEDEVYDVPTGQEVYGALGELNVLAERS